MKQKYLMALSTILVLALVLVSLNLISKDNGNMVIENGIEINGTALDIEIAKDLTQQVKGLSGRQSLPEDRGMLFVYNEPQNLSFWMKDMNFAIDIIWIGSDWRVIDITQNARPNSFPKRFRPSSSAQYVLEVNSGFVEGNNIKRRDIIKVSTDLQNDIQ